MTIFVPALKQQNLLEEIIFTIFVVGSRKMRADDDYSNSEWSIFSPNLNIYGFDVDEDACEQANKMPENQHMSWQEKHFPVALSAQQGKANLYVTKGIDCTSLYPPNKSFLDRLASLNNHIKLDFMIEIETTTLDDVCQTEEIIDPDFLYLDIQGAELDVLKGGKSLVDESILGIHLEVEFASLYKQQPLFAEIDQYLRQQGFFLFDLMSEHPMCRRPRAISPVYSQKRTGQLLWADALYLRDPYQTKTLKFWQTKQVEKIFKLACIADILDYPDYSFELLNYLVSHSSSEFSSQIEVSVRKSLELFQQLHNQ